MAQRSLSYPFGASIDLTVPSRAQIANRYTEFDETKEDGAFEGVATRKTGEDHCAPKHAQALPRCRGCSGLLLMHPPWGRLRAHAPQSDR